MRGFLSQSLFEMAQTLCITKLACLWREVNNHSFPSLAEVKNEWNCTSSPAMSSLIANGDLYLRNCKTYNLCVNYKKFFFCSFLSFGATAPVGQSLLNHEVSRLHTTTPHSQQDSSGRVISSSQRPLPDNTQHSQQKKRPCSRWDSNPQSQQASGRRPAPQTAGPLGSSIIKSLKNKAAQPSQEVGKESVFSIRLKYESAFLRKETELSIGMPFNISKKVRCDIGRKNCRSYALVYINII